MRRAAIVAAVLLAASAARAAAPRRVAIPLSGGGSAVAFHDLVFAPRLGRMLASGGRAGRIFLVDVSSRGVENVAGFAEGISADGAADGALAVDRASMTLVLADPRTGSFAASAALAFAPGTVRYAASTREAWVTEPEEERIEIFAVVEATSSPSLRHASFILVQGGPESLVIDGARGRAYTNLREGMTLAIDLQTHETIARWPNGCKESRGLALDEKAGRLFTACAEGKVVVLDATREGRMLSLWTTSAGLDAVAYGAAPRRLYVPNAAAADLSALDVAPDGKLSPAWTARTAEGARCAAADDRGGVWVCDPGRGRLLLFQDAR